MSLSPLLMPGFFRGTNNNHAWLHFNQISHFYIYHNIPWRL
jgi:hypothetical protein